MKICRIQMSPAITLEKLNVPGTSVSQPTCRRPIFEPGKAKSGLIAFRNVIQKRADLPGRGLNLFTTLFHSCIFDLGSQERRSPDHNGKLIVDGMKDLLRKGHATLAGESGNQTLLEPPSFVFSALNCVPEPMKIQGNLFLF